MGAAFDTTWERARVEAALQVYFDGLYHGDLARLREVFHPEAIYASAVDGVFVRLTMPEYFPVVAGRASPASLGQGRRDRIVSVEFAGPEVAVARVECALPPKHFVDLLTFVRVAGQWRIISKVFHFDLVPPPSDA